MFRLPPVPFGPPVTDEATAASARPALTSTPASDLAGLARPIEELLGGLACEDQLDDAGHRGRFRTLVDDTRQLLRGPGTEPVTGHAAGQGAFALGAAPLNCPSGTILGPAPCSIAGLGRIVLSILLPLLSSVGVAPRLPFLSGGRPAGSSAWISTRYGWRGRYPSSAFGTGAVRSATSVDAVQRRPPLVDDDGQHEGVFPAGAEGPDAPEHVGVALVEGTGDEAGGHALQAGEVEVAGQRPCGGTRRSCCTTRRASVCVVDRASPARWAVPGGKP